MLRINLLPPYIYEGAKRRNVIALWVVVLIAVIVTVVFAKINLDNQAKQIASDTDAIRGKADKADATQTQANNVNGQNAVLKGKRDFVSNSQKYNMETYPPLFDNVNNFTINRVLYSSVVPSNSTVTIAAYAPSLADVGHYMLWMERNPNIASVAIAMNSIPSFPVGGGGQGAQQQQTMGPMGPPTGAFSMMQSMGGGPRANSGGGGMMMGPGGPPGFGGGGGQQGAGTGARPPGGGGHDFTATLTLLNPVPGGPSYSGGGGGGGNAPGGGGPALGQSGMPGGGGMGSPGGGTGSMAGVRNRGGMAAE